MSNLPVLTLPAPRGSGCSSFPESFLQSLYAALAAAAFL